MNLNRLSFIFRNSRNSRSARFLHFGNLVRSRQYEYFNKNQYNTPFWVTHRYKVMLGSIGVVGVCYYATHLENVPISGRTRYMDCDEHTEQTMGGQAFHQILARYQKQILPSYHPYSIYVRNVAERIIKAGGMTDANWEFFVIDSPEANAFVLPGGKVFVFTGLLPIARDEDGLAAVLGHELAHQYARHSAERLSLVRVIFIMQLLLRIFVDTTFITNQVVLNLGLLNPFSRKLEREADYIGLLLMSQACYDPKKAVQLWERMRQAQATMKQPPEYLSTHPSHENRIKNIKEWLPKAEMVRENSNCNSSLFDFFSFNDGKHAPHNLNSPAYAM